MKQKIKKTQASTDTVNIQQEITTVKTATIKVATDEAKLRLFSMFDCFTSVCSDVKDKIFHLKNDDTTLPAYTDYLKCMGSGRGCTTTIFGGKSKGEFANKYSSLGKFPIYSSPLTGMDFTTAGYNYSANAAVHIQLDSLNECDKLCNTEFNDLKKTLEKYDEELHSEYDEKLVARFYEFINNLMLMGWSFDGNFQHFFNKCMLPELENSKIVTKGTYQLADKKIRYSFYNPKLADIIFKNPEFWNIMANETSVNYFDTMRRIKRKKEHAEYCKTTLTKAQVRPVLANNGIKFSISCDGKLAYVLFKLPSVDGNKPEQLNIPCNYQKFYVVGEKAGSPKKSYLSNLIITDNKNGTYTCNYSVNEKRPQTAQLKECFLRMKINNQNWFDKYVDGTLKPEDGPIKATYFDFYFDLSLGVSESPIHDLTFIEVFSKGGVRAHYSSAYPETKELENQSNIPINFKPLVDKPHRLMGIDLGQRNPFAWCVKNNDGSVVSAGHLNGANNENYKKYIDFGNECENLIQLIKETKNYLYGDNEAIDTDNYNKLIKDVSVENYTKYLQSKRILVNAEDQSKNQTHTIKQDNDWIIKDVVFRLTAQYHKLNSGRYNDNDWKQTLYWIDAIYRFIDLQKSFHNFGSYRDYTTDTKVNGTGKGFCSSYYNHINNLNKDTFKKFCFELLPIIKKYGVSCVCFEELKSMYGDKLRSSHDNRLFNLWPVGQLKTFLEGVLKPYNVAVIEVSEQDTSQIVDGKWAYRNKDILTNGTSSVHADEQAASNIVDRALTNHTNLYSLYMINVIDDYWVPNYIWNPKEKGGKRVRGFLTKWYGNSGVVFVKKSNKLVKANISIKQLKTLTGENKPIKKEYWYRINEIEWIDGETKTHLIDKICEQRGAEQFSENLSQDVTPCLTISSVDFSMENSINNKRFTQPLASDKLKCVVSKT